MNELNSKEWHDTLIQMGEKCEVELLDTIAKLEKLLESVDAIRLFVAVIANIVFAPEGSISEATHGHVPAMIETLAYHAYPFFGMSHNREITPWYTNECIEALNKIISLRSIVPRMSRDTREPDALNQIITDVRIYAEIVRGSAYPEQTANEIISVQGYFEDWFAKATGIGPTRAQAILWSIIHAQEYTFNSITPRVRKQAKAAGKHWQCVKRKPSEKRSTAEAEVLEAFHDEEAASTFEFVSTLNAIVPEVLPIGLSDLTDLEPQPTLEEWESLIKLIGMTVHNRRAMAKPIDVRQKPLFVLPDNRVILVDISNALDNLWESFEQVAKTNQGFFSGRYQARKAKWLEQRVIDCLSSIFPSHYIYRNLTYPDPDKNDGSTTELDAAVLWGPFLILIESKAKQFRMESQLGDVGRLRTDIQANVEDAFDQARRAARYIDQAPSPKFFESSSGRRLTIAKGSIHRTYLVTVSQHLLAGLATHLSMFKNLNLFKDGEYPFSISIADLETIARFCEGPDVFLHYIEKRLITQKESLEIWAGELDFFGAYLRTRLQPTRLWESEGLKPKAVWLHGFSAQFDDWYAYKRGNLSMPPSIELEIPNEVRDILQELRKRDEYASRWIAFALLDMSDGILKALADNITGLRKATLVPGMFRRWTGGEGDTVVSILGSLDLPQVLLEQRTQMRAVTEKYRHKAIKSIGLGIMTKDVSKPFHCAMWAEGPWSYDPEMEKLLEDEAPFMPAPGTKLPGRNDPCLCGSGKKFKKCCLLKFEAGRRQIANNSHSQDDETVSK